MTPSEAAAFLRAKHKWSLAKARKTEDPTRKRQHQDDAEKFSECAAMIEDKGEKD